LKTEPSPEKEVSCNDSKDAEIIDRMIDDVNEMN
jgi:hypothetical protein